MKKSSKSLKIILVVLIVILLSLISFIGIYNKTGENLLPEYLLGRNIEGSRVLKYIVQAEDEVTENTTESSEKEATEDMEEKKNLYEEADFLKSKEILEARLKDLGISDYEVRLNHTTGEIFVVLPDDSKTDTVMEALSYTGKFEIKDAETEEILLTNDDIASVKVGYGSSSSTSTTMSVYLTINFNKEGAKKLLDISNQYVKTTDEEGNEIEKKISLAIEDEEVINTYFSEPMTNGQLQLSMGSATSDTSELQGYLEQASQVAIVLDNGKLPLQYTLDQNEYIKSDITQDQIMIVVYVLTAIILLDLIYIIIRYKKMGILSAISYIASIAIFLLLIRYTNTVLVLESIVAFLTLILLNHYLYTRILSEIGKNVKSEEVKNAFKKVYKSCMDLLVVLLIISVVFVYITLASINSIGMLLFWGIISIIIANFAFGRTLLIVGTQK